MVREVRSPSQSSFHRIHHRVWKKLQRCWILCHQQEHRCSCFWKYCPRWCILFGSTMEELCPSDFPERVNDQCDQPGWVENLEVSRISRHASTFLTDVFCSTGDERTDQVTFGEYANTGAGSQGTRASFSTKLSSPISISTVLGSGYASAAWVDTAYLD